MKKLVLFICFVIMAAPGFAKKIANLPEVLKPTYMAVVGDKIYIGTESCKIHIYSRENPTFIKSFLKQGEGPGEVTSLAGINGHKDYLLVEGGHNLLFFTPIGEYIKEQKQPPGISWTRPIGKNYLARHYYTDRETLNRNFNICIIDEKLNLIKILEKNFIMIEGKVKSGRKVLNPIRHVPVHRTFRDKIFIADNLKGFHITLYNDQGEVIRVIKKEYKKIPVSQEYKDEFIGKFKKLPGWPEYKKRFEFKFPEYYSPISDFFVDANKIYPLLFTPDPDKKELWVMDFQGKILSKHLVPVSKYWGRRAVKDNIFYYLVDNEETEMIELHAQELK